MLLSGFLKTVFGQNIDKVQLNLYQIIPHCIYKVLVDVKGV
jgi:hypothetical protein